MLKIQSNITNIPSPYADCEAAEMQEGGQFHECEHKKGPRPFEKQERNGSGKLEQEPFWVIVKLV
jgi:hypothetical protein